MIDLTPEQRQVLEQPGPPLIRDPQTNETYVLVKSSLFERLKGVLDEGAWAEDAYRASMEVFARDGWDDPRMDVYNELDLRQSS